MCLKHKAVGTNPSLMRFTNLNNKKGSDLSPFFQTLKALRPFFIQGLKTLSYQIRNHVIDDFEPNVWFVAGKLKKNLNSSFIM